MPPPSTVSALLPLMTDRSTASGVVSDQTPPPAARADAGVDSDPGVRDCGESGLGEQAAALAAGPVAGDRAARDGQADFIAVCIEAAPVGTRVVAGDDRVSDRRRPAQESQAA